ncbi:hypothetical protein Droror1_Dr00001162 [Drosera rotundifolia]
MVESQNRKKIIGFDIYIYSAFVNLSCTMKPPTKRKSSSSIDNNNEKKQKSMAMDFALHVTQRVLLSKIRPGREGSNAICSPLSITLMLNLLTGGAEGATRDQLLGVLGFKMEEDLKDQSLKYMSLANSTKQEPVIMLLVNSAWVNSRLCSLVPEFGWTARSVYQAEVDSVDFKTEDVAVKVNEWVNEATKGLIKQVLPPKSVSDVEAVILANALYFKGKWDQPFLESSTKDKEFHLLGGNIVKVPFMNKYKRYYQYGTFDGYKVLEIPYKRDRENQRTNNSSFSMYVFLPDKKDGLSGLLENLMQHINDGLIQLTSTKISTLSIPKFKF